MMKNIKKDTDKKKCKNLKDGQKDKTQNEGENKKIRAWRVTKLSTEIVSIKNIKIQKQRKKVGKCQKNK